MTEAERLAERTPERIWLIDMGDCIAWCDDPDPAGTGDDDAVEYVRATLIRQQSAHIAALEEKNAHLEWLLEGRDSFIVNKGLFPEFVDGLPRGSKTLGSE